MGALQLDLLANGGSGCDGDAPIAIRDFNHGRVTTETGVLDQGTAACIADLLQAPSCRWLPDTPDPVQQNAQAIKRLRAMRGGVAPVPFLLAIFQQESGCLHYQVPHGDNQDDFVTVGLDGAVGSFVIPSRGYGIGQYTLFHHPPKPDEVGQFIVDPVGNVGFAAKELRDKFDHFVVSGNPAARADDRAAEHPLLPLRTCRYMPADARYLTDCAACAKHAGSTDIVAGQTPLYPGSTATFAATPTYQVASYRGVPVRANFLCDWPYAARRYNGAGIDSYHYQTRILLNLAAPMPGP